jgi:hypothetical protein
MRILIALFLSMLSVSAAERITMTITLTNTPGTTNAITVNGDVRYWTNASASGTILTNLTGKNASTTNLYNQIASFPYAGPLTLRYANTNSITLLSTLGGALAGSISGTWATISLSTQSGPQTYTALWPLENMVGATNRTNEGSAFVYGLSTYSTQAFATNSTAVSNLVQKGAGPRQYVLSETLFQTLLSSYARFTNATLINSTNSGYIVALTNGYWTNATINSATITNLTVPGSGTSSVQLNGTASGNFSLAVGGTASGYSSTAIGVGSTASSHAAVALGTTSTASATNALALGTDATAAANNSVAIGAAAGVADADSIAIGTSAASTTTNQIVLGSASYKVTVPGRIEGAISTNSTLRGTNIVNGRLDFTSRANTSLANGNNAAVVLGTNVYVRMSGPSASYTINGIAAEQDGSWHIAEFVNPVNSLIIADNSGTDPTAANRIRTGTGGDVTFTNNPVVLQFIYNASDARWKIANWFR